MKKFTLLLLLLAFVYSCQKSENPAPEENEDNIPPAPAEIVISDNYLPLTQQNSTCTAYDTLSGAVEMYISDTTLVPKMGNVIVVDLDTLGAIRRITSVENLSSGSYRFTTEHATMGDIFEKGHFAISTSNETSTKAGIPVYTPDRIIYIGDGEQNYTKGQITKRLLEAEVPLGEKRVWEKDDDNYISFTDESNISSSLDLVMEFNFDNIQQIAHNYKHNLIEFKAYLEGNVKTAAGLSLEINGKYEEEIERELKKNIIKPVAYWTTVQVGLIPVPVFVTCTTDLLSDASLTVEGNFGASVGASYLLNGKSGFQYQQSTNKVTSFNEVTESVETFPPTITAEISIENKASVFPRVSVFLYGLIGPIIEMKPYFAQNAKGSVEVKLTDKKDKVGAALTYSASVGMDICGKLHLDPFGDEEEDKDIEVMDLQLFEKEIYRSPHKIEKKEVKTAEGGEKKVVFEVYDTLAIQKKVVPTTIPIPVVVTKSSTDNKQSSDNSSAPTKESFEVKRVTEGKIEVPVDKNTSTVEEVKQTINADIYSNTGTKISNASHTEVVESDLREILIAFYKSTDGDNWTYNENWCSEAPIGTWYGIYFNENGGLDIYLNDNNLKGDGLLSGCTSLINLNCGDNQLTSLDVSGCTSLEELRCYNNQLTSLDVSGFTSLAELSCSSNQLTSLDVSGCTSLESLYYSNGQLTSLNVSGCTSLTRLYCDNNQLTSLDLTGCTSLNNLDCYNNKITSVIPNHLIDKWHNFSYDRRYEYWPEYDKDGNRIGTKVKDKGRGWWYPGEPGKLYHGK